MATRITILGISGSLRSSSSNQTLLNAAARLAPDGVSVGLSESVGLLPHFNPDLDGEGMELPREVAEFHERIRQADAILISSPEYIHGVPGSFKNALDWTASSGVFIGKPLALINASATSNHAQDSLIETLTVLMADVTSSRIPLRSNRLSLDDVLADSAIVEKLQEVLATLINAVNSRTSE